MNACLGYCEQLLYYSRWIPGTETRKILPYTCLRRMSTCVLCIQDSWVCFLSSHYTNVPHSRNLNSSIARNPYKSGMLF